MVILFCGIIGEYSLVLARTRSGAFLEQVITTSEQCSLSMPMSLAFLVVLASTSGANMAGDMWQGVRSPLKLSDPILTPALNVNEGSRIKGSCLSLHPPHHDASQTELDDFS